VCLFRFSIAGMVRERCGCDTHESIFIWRGFGFWGLAQCFYSVFLSTIYSQELSRHALLGICSLELILDVGKLFC
jgi:hypothetical protein